MYYYYYLIRSITAFYRLDKEFDPLHILTVNTLYRIKVVYITILKIKQYLIINQITFEKLSKKFHFNNIIV